MYEAASLHYYLTKYGFLALGPLGLMISLVDLLMSEGAVVEPPWVIGIIGCIISIGYYFGFTKRFRRVAVGRMKLMISENKIETEYSWLDVEFIHLNRFQGYYELKIKDKDDSIYFLPYGFVGPLMGDTSEMGDYIRKAKKDYNI